MVFDYEAIVEGLGYVGIFLASLLGSVVPFLPAPYLVPIVVAITEFGLNSVIVILLSSLGATVGKVALFLGSRAGRKLLSEDAKSRMEPLQNFLLKHGWIAVFIAAATPIPDDVVYIPMAIGGFNVVKFLLPLFVGKLALTAIVAFSALYVLGFFRIFVSESSTDFAIALSVVYIIVVVSVSYMFTKVDWRKVFSQRTESKNS